MKEMRRLLSFLLVLVMVVGFVPAQAFAAEEDVALLAALDEAKAYINALTINNSQNDPETVVSTWQKQFTWDNEKRESADKGNLYDWSYYNGVVFEGLEYLYEVSGESAYKNYVVEYMSSLIDADGTWAITANNSEKTAAGYDSEHGADSFKTASLLLDAYEMTGDDRYLTMAATLYADLDKAAESYLGSNVGDNYLHTWASDPTPDLWLDGLYMILPFRAEYAKYIGDTEELDLIVQRLQWVSDNMYNEDTGLFYHAADNAESNSNTYWLRSIGWYAAAMVDVMDHMSGGNLMAMQSQLAKLVNGMQYTQSRNNGMWLNNLVEAESDTNPYETSGTALVAYAILKAVNNGWLDASYAGMALTAFMGICDEKLENGVLTDICFKGTPGSSNSEFKDDEGKGVGPFIMLYAEVLEYYNVQHTLVGLSVTAAPTKTFYIVGEKLDLTGMVVTATYGDGHTEAVTDYTVEGFDSETAGAKILTISYGGLTASTQVDVYGKPQDFSTEVDVEMEGGPINVSVNTTMYGDNEIVFTITDMTPALWVKEAAADLVEEGYIALDITPDDNYVPGTAADVTIPIPAGMDADKFAVYYIPDQGYGQPELMPGHVNEDGTYTFTTTHFSTFVGGQSKATEHQTVTVGGTTTKTVYVLTNTLTAGKNYLIVSTNTAGNGVLLVNNGGNPDDVTTTIRSGNLTINGNTSNKLYIEDPAANAVWEVSRVNNAYRFVNGGKYLCNRSENEGWYDWYGVLELCANTNNNDHRIGWSYNSGENRLYRGGTNNDQNDRLGYQDGEWKLDVYDNSNVYKVYFYEETEARIDTSITYELNGEDLSVVVDTNGTTTANLEKSITATNGGSTNNLGGTYTYEFDNSIITSIENGVVTFTGTEGATPVVIRYTWTAGGTEYTISDTVVVSAKNPSYQVEIYDEAAQTEGKDRVYVTRTIVRKGIKGGEVIALGADVFEESVGIGNTKLMENATVTWTSNRPGVAKVDQNGNVTLTGLSGTAQITATYTFANGTQSVSDTVTISASVDSATVPSDGTDDFPEYPNEGAVRIDKTAQAVGNFSQTGIAQVELSMTGVPYSVENEIDVIIMIDMSTSMKFSQNGGADRVTPARKASSEALEALVTTNGKINGNRVAIYTFNGYTGYEGKQDYDDAVHEVLPMQKYNDPNNPSALSDAKQKLANWIVEGNTDEGTNYGAALEKCYEVLNETRTEGRKQFVIFVTDGEPTTGFAYVNDKGGVSDDGYDNAYSQGSASKYYTYTEYYSTEMKKDGVEVYTIGVQLPNNADNARTILRKIAGTSTGNAYDDPETPGPAVNPGHAQFISGDANVNEELSGIFNAFVTQILEAATDITVTDLVSPNYSMIFDFPNKTVEDVLGADQEFYIEVVNYPMTPVYDTDGETVIDYQRGNPTTLQRVYLDGSKPVDANGNEMTPVYDNDGKMISGAEVTGSGDKLEIVTPYFTYTADGQKLVWTADSLNANELAIRYFVYLDKSAGYTGDDATPAGTYPTNVEAKINYTNYKGTKCEIEFPVPQLTWNGAQVSYVFYLVNSKGQPVNHAGLVVPFSEAVYVTDVFTYAVTWNDDSTNKLEATYLASEYLPSVYQLYDAKAEYDIHVYEDEIGTVLNNYFIIRGTEGTVPNTTYVFNTKSGDKYNAPGAYSAMAGTYYYTGENGTRIEYTVSTDTAEMMEGFDFANTTVAFAVTWEATLSPDTVVIDFGLPVDIDISTNDAVTGGLTGLMAEKPTRIEMNTGKTTTNFLTSRALDLAHGSAEVIGGGTIRYTPEDMEMNVPENFYYASKVTFYQGDTLMEYNMYSSVTVIPATTVYYEDEFVDLKTYTRPDANTDYSETEGWPVDSELATATQASDRPGPSLISGTLDADNNYGYDAAYDNCSMYSMGHAAIISVNANQYGTAEFSFYGTGFDVIALTSNQTGTLIVQVYDENNKVVKTASIDTYYGYTYGIYEVTYTLTNGKWVQTRIGDALPEGSTAEVYDTKDELIAAEREEKDGVVTATGYIKVWKAVENDPNALYQVPVMKISGLTYGRYTAKISALYYGSLDHTTGADGYDLYLDAIRIYDPTGVASGSTTNETVSDAYNKDGENYPMYIEVRDEVIQESGATVTRTSLGKYQVELPDGNDGTVGLMFIDSNPENTSISDYIKYGPNNELYLAKGQAATFNLDLSSFVDSEGKSIVADVQIGLKLANGDNGNAAYQTQYQMHNALSGGATTNVLTGTITTATDMYYSIKDLTSGTVVITNTGDGILSITNLKITFTQKPNSTSKNGVFHIDGESATNAVNSLSYVRPSTANFSPETMDITFSRTTASVGNNVIVTVTTSDDVKDLLVNGKIATNKTTSYLTGETTWTFTVPVVENGSLKVTVVGYDTNGEYTVPYSESVTVVNMSGNAEDLLGKLFG